MNKKTIITLTALPLLFAIGCGGPDAESEDQDSLLSRGSFSGPTSKLEPKPDLVPVDLSCTPYGISFKIKNRGNATASASWVHVQKSYNAAIDRVSSLAPGEEEPMTVYFRRMGEGSFTINADYSHVIGESDESNNLVTNFCVF